MKLDSYFFLWIIISMGGMLFSICGMLIFASPYFEYLAAGFVATAILNGIGSDSQQM